MEPGDDRFTQSTRTDFPVCFYSFDQDLCPSTPPLSLLLIECDSDL